MSLPGILIHATANDFLPSILERRLQCRSMRAAMDRDGKHHVNRRTIACERHQQTLHQEWFVLDAEIGRASAKAQRAASDGKEVAIIDRRVKVAMLVIEPPPRKIAPHRARELGADQAITEAWRLLLDIDEPKPRQKLAEVKRLEMLPPRQAAIARMDGPPIVVKLPHSAIAGDRQGWAGDNFF
jgi:hypothetical protein